MALTFPGSPAIDDQTTTGGRTYQWTGYAWDLVGSGIAGPTGPAGSGTPVVIAVGTGSGDQPTNLALGGNVYDITFNGTGVVANPTGTHTDGQQILWRITRTAAEAVTLGTDFTIVTGTVSNTANYRTFIRGTYSSADATWFSDIQNVEVIPPVFAGVALLLHLDGADTSTVFTDSSSLGLTVTPYGNAQISTAQSVFGGASALFDGTGDYLETTFPDVDWSADFTVECWLRQTTGGSYQAVFSAGNLQSGVGGVNFYIAPGGAIEINNGVAGNISGGSVVPGVWTHIALVQVSGTSYAYQDGVAIGSGATNYPVQTGVVRVGANPNYSQYFSGHIDELRIVKGQAVYTGAFSPPASPLTDPV